MPKKICVNNSWQVIMLVVECQYLEKEGSFFVPIFIEVGYSPIFGDWITEVPKNESKNHISLHRVQTAQLQHKEKQKEHSWQTGDE